MSNTMLLYLWLMIVPFNILAQQPKSIPVDEGYGEHKYSPADLKELMLKNRFTFNWLITNRVKPIAMQFEAIPATSMEWIVIEGDTGYRVEHKTVPTKVPIELRLVEYHQFGAKGRCLENPLLSPPYNSMTINGQIYNLDSIFCEPNYHSDSMYCVLTTIEEIYQFDFNQNTYCGIYTTFYSGASYMHKYKVVLIDFNAEKPVVISCPDKQTSSSMMMFGDLNNNNRLDYIYFEAHIAFRQDTIAVYELQNQAFKRIDDFYVRVVTDESIQGPLSFYKIDTLKSKWFFDLNQRKRFFY
jgi:hypothetical protein